MRRAVLICLAMLLGCFSAESQTLKQSTAISLTLWLFNTADSTPKTGVTVTTITVRYVKADGTTASFSPTASGGSNDMVEKGHGAYYQEFTAAQLDTLGVFDVGCSVSGGVCAPTVYDIKPAASFAFCCEGNVGSALDFWHVLLTSISTSGSIGKLIKDDLDLPISAGAGRIDYGTAQAGASTTITLAAGASGTANYYRDARIVLLGGTGAGQRAIITAYNQTTKVATIFCEGPRTATGAWFTNPDSTTTYVILPRNR